MSVAARLGADESNNAPIIGMRGFLIAVTIVIVSSPLPLWMAWSNCFSAGSHGIGNLSLTCSEHLAHCFLRSFINIRVLVYSHDLEGFFDYGSAIAEGEFTL